MGFLDDEDIIVIFLGDICFISHIGCGFGDGDGGVPIIGFDGDDYLAGLDFLLEVVQFLQGGQ